MLKWQSKVLRLWIARYGLAFECCDGIATSGRCRQSLADRAVFLADGDVGAAFGTDFVFSNFNGVESAAFGERLLAVESDCNGAESAEFGNELLVVDSGCNDGGHGINLNGHASIKKLLKEKQLAPGNGLKIRSS